MSYYTLTNTANTLTGLSGADFFSGAAGESDTLKGGAGNDTFDIQVGQYGSIDGGANYDRLHLTGPGFNNEFHSLLSISNIEELVMDAQNLFTTVTQLSGFSKFSINNNSEEFHFFLQGAGGTLDFSNKYFEPNHLVVDAAMTTSGVKIIGSTYADDLFGSDFNDQLNGFKGADEVRGGAGNDTLNGGLGNDYLYGDDGLDYFAFDTALPGNFDHIGDFRGVDDTIKLDNAIFTALGLATGTLSSSAFKVLGTGDSVDGTDRIIYNFNNGVLYYDPDGSGSIVRQAIVALDNFSGDIPTLTNLDIYIS
ncbi:MAG: hypothetical protein JWR75_1212 [Devosia sp.]|nr:hypothetical protein [Devosia sp.]